MSQPSSSRFEVSVRLVRDGDEAVLPPRSRRQPNGPRDHRAPPPAESVGSLCACDGCVWPCYPASVSEEAQSRRNEPSETAEAIVQAGASLVLWDQASTIGTPEGVILTLFHNLPLYDIDGELVGGTKKPIAYYMMSGADLFGTAELLARQAVAWAGQFGSEEMQANVEAAILAAVEEGRVRAEAGRREAEEEGESDDDS